MIHKKREISHNIMLSRIDRLEKALDERVEEISEGIANIERELVKTKDRITKLEKRG